MGYYTRFSLTTDSENTVELIAELRAQNEDAEYALDEDGSSTGAARKWYTHGKDMAAFSAEHPDVLSTLYGEGEESGDLWRLYARNGKTQTAKAVLTYAKPTI